MTSDLVWWAKVASASLMVCSGSGTTEPAVCEMPPALEQASDPAPRTVLLIPGTLITGDAFDVMFERLVEDGYRPVVYEPDDLFTRSLADGAEGISCAVERALAETGATSLDIVAECDGGVATRYYLQILGASGNVDRVVTMVSAHHGTQLAPLARFFTGYQAMRDITPDSDFMKELNATELPDDVQFTSIYSCHDWLMKPRDTSVVPGANNVEICDDENRIGHFDVFEDAGVYEQILRALSGTPVAND